MSQTFPYDDPWVALSAWMEAATHSEPRVPDAMQLATVGGEGRRHLRLLHCQLARPGLLRARYLGRPRALALRVVELPDERLMAVLHP